MIKKIIKMTFIGIGTLILLLILVAVIFFNTAPQIGGKSEGERLERVKASPQYNDGVFVNSIVTPMDMSFKDLSKTMWDFIRGNPNRQPAGRIETIPFDPERFVTANDTEIVVSWFGHSSVIMRIDGVTILADPVFSNRASMFSFMGPERYEYSNHISVDQLPPLDIVILSHDHYDHLDHKTILALKDKVKAFYVPLGVGAHLEYWGVPAEHIVELDWWDEVAINNQLELVLTPTRHFSGRSMTDRFATLWGSWVIKGQKQRIFFGGDSGYFEGFKTIGEKYGPFDLTMLECGQYNQRWRHIHMMPEETAQAHLDLKGEVLMPIHWGKFTLALHAWKDPVERVTKKAEELGIQISTPEVGELMIIHSIVPDDFWWKNLN